MKRLLHTRTLFIIGAVLLVGGAVFFISTAAHTDKTDYVTTTVDRGAVTEIISVSGNIEANDTAALAFPQGGIITDIPVSEGDTVEKGTVLASLTQASLLASRDEAYAAVRIARADRDELLNGPRTEERTITTRTVSIAAEQLNRAVQTQGALVEHARRTLLSTDLAVIPKNKNTDDTPPILSGMYHCEPGVYTLDIFGSSAATGYSYRLSGVESGTFTAYTRSAAPLGDCGLFIQFDESETYANAQWTITIPNTRGESYTANLQAYQLAQTTQQNEIESAEEALLLTQEEATLANAKPREEAVARAAALVQQAEARLATIDAELADRIIVAPFTGTITTIAAVTGEAIGATPLVTMVANDTFKLTARIPEIDITKIKQGLPAQVLFDAHVEEILPATITFISPLAIEIDGVAYFEATLAIHNPPEWIRGGLNADIDIEIHKTEEVLRIPKRFITTEADGTHSVLVPNGDTTRSISITRGFVGNDGFVEITGLNEGVTVIAP